MIANECPPRQTDHMPKATALAADPRIERTRRVVLTAAIDLLAEVGYRGTTIEAVAARSGVAKSTIYRHWAGKDEMLEDAFAELKPPFDVRVGGSARLRITDLLEQLATHTAGSDWSSCLPAMIEAAEHVPSARKLQRKISTERRKVLLTLLREGVASGELPPHIDPDLAADCLAGAIMVRRLMSLDVLKTSDVPNLVAQVLPEHSSASEPARPARTLASIRTRRNRPPSSTRAPAPSTGAARR